MVNTNGSPVAGPVDLKVELSYSGTPTSILCTQDFNDVALSNGVFHLKLNLTCPSTTLSDVLINVPANETTSLRVVDVSDPAHPKAYSFQAMHTMPFANIAEKAKQLVQMGASNGQILKWNNTSKNWEPGSAGGVGSVTDVTVTSPLSVSNGTSVPALSISQANSTTSGYLSSADWNSFNSKQGSIAAGTNAQYYRGDKTWQTLDSDVVPEGATNLYFTNARVLGLPLTGFSPTSSAILATDSVVQGFSKAQGQINTINSAAGNFLVKNNTDVITGTVNVGVSGFLTITNAPSILTDATNKQYVDTRDALKVNKAGDTMSGDLTLDSDLKIKGGSNYVTVKGHASSAVYDLVLPSSAGTSGYVLRTDGAGNLSWIDPSAVSAGSGTVGSGSITDGSIVDADINTGAAIAQSKIANLTTDLAAKVSTTLNSGNILVGNGSNVATAVTVSGDATLDNTGALTLKNTGTAGTYTKVTTDVQGRVTSGTSPTTLSGLGITDVLVKTVTGTAPVTVTGTATDPVVGMPAATTTADGYLTAANWNTFNNKQATISKTTVQDVSKLRIYGANTTNYVELSAATLSANRSLIFPDSNGSNGNFLTTDGAGNLSWTSPSTSTIGLVGDIGGTTGANTIGAGKVTLTHLSATGTRDATTYLKGDNTFATFATDVRATLLTGLSTATNAVITASDSVLGSLGKLQKQISDLAVSAVGGDLTGTLPNPTIAKLQGNTVTTSAVANKNVLKYNGSAWVNSMMSASDLSATGTADGTTYLAGDNSWKTFRSEVRSTPITGLDTTGINYGNSPIAAVDSLLVALNKLRFTQGDYVSKTANQTIFGSLSVNSLTGFITVPNPVNPTDAVNKQYVDGFGQWTLSGSDAYRSGGRVGIGAAPVSSSAIFEMTSTTQGFLPPRMTTTQRDAIGSPVNGLTIYNTTTQFYEYYNGSGWNIMGGGVPNGTISAFESTTCPVGWVEYTAARGQFLRGIDNGAGVDPSGTRAPGNPQADSNKSHAHTASSSADGTHNHTGSTTTDGWHDHTGTTTTNGNHGHPINAWYAGDTTALIVNDWSTDAILGTDNRAGPGFFSTNQWTNGAGDHNHSFTTAANGNHAHSFTTSTVGNHGHTITVNADGGTETRPKNIAVLYCKYIGGTPTYTPPNLEALGTVNVTAPANGQALVYNSGTGKWVNQAIGSALGFNPVNKAGDTMTGTLTVPTVRFSDTSTQTTSAFGPVFSVYTNTATSTSTSVNAKIQYNLAEFDPDSCLDAANSRIKPTKAGYYKVSLVAGLSQTGNGGLTNYLSLYKNGTAYKNISALVNYGAGYTDSMQLSTVVYMNGTTDYLEGWFTSNNGTYATTIITGSGNTYFSGEWIRP